MLQTRSVLRWTYIGRVSLAVAISAAVLYVWPTAVNTDGVVAGFALATVVLVTGASAWYGEQFPTRIGRTFGYIQALTDLGLVTAVVYITGGVTSQFAALYVLVIVSATLLLPAWGGLLISALGIVAYCATVVLGHGANLDLVVWLQLAVFAAVALGTGYLASRLRQAGIVSHELEQRLAATKLQAEDILRNIRSGVLTIDQHGRIVYGNPAAGHLLGLDLRTLLGRPVAEALAGSAPDLADALLRAMRGEERVTRGEMVISAHGRSFPLGLTTTTVDSSGAVGPSATAIFQDITDHKRLEVLRLRAERLEGVAELSASLAHEIKNPLASIRSAVEQLARAQRVTEDERVLSSLIVRETDRLARLLSEFLDFARTRVAASGCVDLGQIVRAATSLAAAHPDCRADVLVTCTAPSDPLLVEGDEDLLHRAVFNIMLNAVQAASARGRVMVELAPIADRTLPGASKFAPEAVSLSIHDTGPGIPADIRDRVFDPFFTTKPGGSGLGLPIAYRAIEAHRGVLLVDSDTAGTRFTVLLPRTHEHTTGEA